PQPKLPEGISIMEQFKLITDHMVKYIEGPPAHITGAVNMIRPDGTQPAPEGFTGPAESIPWGLNIDGNDDVWVGNSGVVRPRCWPGTTPLGIRPARRPAMSSTFSRAAASRW